MDFFIERLHSGFILQKDNKQIAVEKVDTILAAVIEPIKKAIETNSSVFIEVKIKENLPKAV